MTQPGLFPITTPMGHLPVGARFTYAGWGQGTVTSNDGHTVKAVIEYHGHPVATCSDPLPGEEVEVA